MRALASLAKDPLSNWNDQAGLFRGRDELTRRNQSHHGPLPANQGLEADKSAVRKGNDRLIIEPEFTALQGSAHLTFQFQAIDSQRMHFRVEYFTASLPGSLGAV